MSLCIGGASLTDDEASETIALLAEMIEATVAVMEEEEEEKEQARLMEKSQVLRRLMAAMAFGLSNTLQWKEVKNGNLGIAVQIQARERPRPKWMRKEKES